MGLTIGLVMALLIVVLVIGDRVGLTVNQLGPAGMVASGSTVDITFDEAIDPASAADHIALSPPVSGKISVNDARVIFVPDRPLAAGRTYTAIAKAGIRATSGRQLLSDQQWNFKVRAATVSVLAPDNGIVLNLFLIDPAAPDKPQQITNSEKGLLSFDALPDGSRIVYAELQERGMANLSVYDVRTRTTRVLLRCDNATCANPVWRPDGSMVAFERAEFNPDAGIGPGAPRIWLLDLTTNKLRRILSDSQRLGYTPRFSPDGSKLAFYDAGQRGIVVYDFVQQKDSLIATPQGEVGKFSPDSRWIYFPRIVQLEDGSYISYFVLVDLNSDTATQRDLTPDIKGASDVEAVWTPDGSGLIVLRRLPGAERMTKGQQLFVIDLATGKSKLLMTDDSYANGQMDMSPAGEIVMRRTKLGKPGVQSEIWTYNLTTNALKLITTNAALPRWLP